MAARLSSLIFIENLLEADVGSSSKSARERGAFGLVDDIARGVLRPRQGKVATDLASC